MGIRKMANEDFYEAAIRHWIDGNILEEQEEYDNAVCMQGFAAECALKKIMDMLHVMDDVKKYNHFGGELFQDIKMILSGDIEMTTLIHPACGLRLSAILLPSILFQDHPGRRYFKDGRYIREDAEECRNAANRLIEEMVNMYLDGYL